MYDAIQTAMGKPNSPMRAVYIGTLAPARDGWWHGLVGAGSAASTHVTALQGDADKWDTWGGNPPVQSVDQYFGRLPAQAASRTRTVPQLGQALAGNRFAEGMATKLSSAWAGSHEEVFKVPFLRSVVVTLEERDAARKDSRLRARFLSYRLNIPTADEASMLLSTADWSDVLARDVPEAEGSVQWSAWTWAVGRAWSAATACYPSGRTEAIAVAPGIPSHLKNRNAGIGLLEASTVTCTRPGGLRLLRGCKCHL